MIGSTTLSSTYIASFIMIQGLVNIDSNELLPAFFENSQLYQSDSITWQSSNIGQYLLQNCRGFKSLLLTMVNQIVSAGFPSILEPIV